MSWAVATGHTLTSRVAADILSDGGSAVDACIAAACTAFLVEPVLAQPLGGGFLMAVEDRGTPKLLDAFVQTPRRKRPEGELDIATVTVDFGTATQDFHIGAGTAAAPCLIPALFDAHDRLGRMPMTDLVAHAVRLGRDGFAIGAAQAHIMSLVAPILTEAPEVAALYAPDGPTLQEGSAFRNAALADVLEVMALEGPRFFTEGEIARALVELPGGHLTGEDLRRARHVWRAPLDLDRRGTRIWLNPPPSLGGAQIALALSALPDAPDPETVAAALLAIAAIRAETGIDDRPGDAGRILLDPARVETLRATLRDHPPARRGTTHISVVDARGNGAAMTLSNGESCGRLLPGTGILPNNMLGEEDLVRGGPTAWAPDIRLASMMCPMALRAADGTLTLMGSGGSNRIRSALTTTALALIDFGLDLDSAVQAPRMHAEGAELSFEDLDGGAWRERLLRHWPEAVVWDAPSMFFGGVHAVRRSGRGGVEAAGDPRRAGAPLTG